MKIKSEFSNNSTFTAILLLTNYPFIADVDRGKRSETQQMAVFTQAKRGEIQHF